MDGRGLLIGTPSSLAPARQSSDYSSDLLICPTESLSGHLPKRPPIGNRETAISHWHSGRSFQPVRQGDLEDRTQLPEPAAPDTDITKRGSVSFLVKGY